MAKKLEAIIRERIDIPAIAKAIRAEGYRTQAERKSKKSVVLGGSFLDKLHSPDRFQKLGDGWVRDNLLGLDWGPSSTERMIWEKAKKYAAEQGGRLPEVDELASLIDRSKYNPAINKEASPDTKTDDWYWTNTRVAWDSGRVWSVYFSFGLVDNYFKGYCNYVRPVRSSK